MLLTKLAKKQLEHYMAILGHDPNENGFTPVCSTKVEVASLTTATNVAACDQLRELKVSSTSKITVGAFAARKADKLEKTVLNSGTFKYEVEEMSFRGNVAAHTILFASDRYTAGVSSAFDTVIASTSHDSTTRCGLSCADDYYDNTTTYDESSGARAYTAPLCTSSTDLDSRHCELDQLDYQQEFMSRQIVHDTLIDCKDVTGTSKLETMEFYLGTGCGTLTFGDLTKCDALKYIYLHQGVDYATSGANTAVTCANKFDSSGASFPTSLKFVWSNDESTINDARKKITDKDVHFGVAAVIKNFDGSTVNTAGEMCAEKFNLTAYTGQTTVAGVNSLVDIQNTPFASLKFDTLSVAVNATCKYTTATAVVDATCKYTTLSVAVNATCKYANNTDVLGFTTVTSINGTTDCPGNTFTAYQPGYAANTNVLGFTTVTSINRTADCPGNTFTAYKPSYAANTDVLGFTTVTSRNGTADCPGNTFTAYKPIYSSLLTNKVIATTTGDQTYLVGGKFALGRFNEVCKYAKNLVLPDSVLLLSDSAVLDLEVVFTATTADPDFVIKVGEKLNKVGNVPDIDLFALFIAEQTNAVVQRRCPTMTEGRDAGTDRVRTGSTSTPYTTSDALKSAVNIKKGVYGDVLYGNSIDELNANSETITRNIGLTSAYDGVTASRGPGSCFQTAW